MACRDDKLDRQTNASIEKVKTDLLLTNATFVTVNGTRDVIFDGAMAVADGCITAVGPSAEVEKTCSGPDTTIVDLGGKVVFPGFVNTHNHLFQTLLKGLGDDMVLKDWLSTMTFPAATHLSPDDCHAAAVLGIIEGIRSGMTCELDYMYAHPRSGLDEPILQAMDECGVRGIFGYGAIDTGLDFGVDPGLVNKSDDVIRELDRLCSTYDGSADGRLRVWAAPAALWSNSERMFRGLYEVVCDHGDGVTIHVSETPFDREATVAEHGCAGTECLERLGIDGPNVLMVHCVWLTDDDIKRAAEHDYKVSYNPVSNMYLASGVAPIPKMLRAGVTVGLGVDGAASNNGQDMLELMKTAVLLQKVESRDPVALTAEKALEMATIDGARALGLDDQIGSLEPGKRADFVVFDPYASPKSIPMHNPVSDLVYSSAPSCITDVAVDGRFLLRDGELTVVDEHAALAEAQRCADDLCARAGITNRGSGHAWTIPVGM
ncbi:MAG: amidohydrolase family protein [Tractidigestivibacter sp.]|jgi:5-methylthioadenosine/S-adenosylhomocysteine deaminase|uniref:amidohydrolase family protein n=1 Tax=Tractidigestivibacter sp. TaxID=2847320 RepID=UPI003D9378AD